MRPLQRMMPVVVIVFFILDACVGAAFVLDKVFNMPKELSAFVNLNREGNLPTWYAAIQLFIVGSLFGLFAWRHFDRRQRRSWLLQMLPLMFWLMSLDEVAQLHETIGALSQTLFTNAHVAQTIFPKTGYWIVVIGAPFLLMAFGLFRAVRSYLAHPPHLLRLFLLGFVVMMIGALGFETLHNYIGDKGTMWRFMLIVAEEMSEMIGVTIMLWAAVDLLKAHGCSIEFRHTEVEARRYISV